MSNTKSWLVSAMDTTEFRNAPASAVVWKLALCCLNVGSYYVVSSIKSNYFKSFFAKIGADTDKIDETQLKLFKITTAVRVLKQNIWTLAMLNYGLPVYYLITWPLFEGFTDIATIWAYAKYGDKKSTFNLSKKWMNIVGLLLFFFGGIMESGHDYLLTQFKTPTNKGKVYVDGFAKYITYPNYAGYILWRTGQALLSNNIIFSAGMSSFWFSFFAFLSIPDKEQYLITKYGAQYEQYIAKTSKLIPGVY
eukprot:403578_1